MSSRHRLLLVVCLVCSVAVVSGTGGFAATRAERAVSVAVTDDQSALLRFQQNLTANGTELNVTVGNQFPDTPLTSVVVTVGGNSTNLAASESLGPGESATATFESVACGDSISVVALGEGVRVELTRTVGQAGSRC